MGNIKVILVFISLFLIAITASAQDELLFLNGKQLEGKILEYNKYQLTFQTKKDKELTIENYRLFSFSKDSRDTIL